MKLESLHLIKDDMVAFIEGHGMRRLPGYVTEEVPTVLFEEDNPDGWKDFVEHAKAAGAPFVTMSEVVLEKADVAMLIEQLREHIFPVVNKGEEEEADLEEAESLVKHVGKTGYIQLGFAYQGVMVLYETSTEWYEGYQDLMDSSSGLGGLALDDHDRDQDE